MLAKMHQDKQYFEKSKEQKEYLNTQIRENSIKNMIEKERIQAALVFMKRAPNIDSLKGKLKEYNIITQEDTPKEE